MNNTVLVTCLYHVKYTQPIGGRGYPVITYFPSLINILNFNLPIIIYTDSETEHFIRTFLENYNHGALPDYEIRVHDLSTYRHYNTILEKKVKYVNPDYRYYHRCEVLCHTKLYFAEQAYNNKWGKTNVVWIDAGITEASKIPIKYGGTELGEGIIINKYRSCKYPHNKECMFTPQLGVSLDTFVNKEKWFFTQLNSLFDGCNSPWFTLLQPEIQKYFNIELTTSCKWVVGTIWGGEKSKFDTIYKYYNELVDKLVETEMFPKTEEMYLSVINYGLKYKTLNFDTWYTDIPGEAEYMGTFWDHENTKPIKAKSFYKVFYDILEYK